MTPIQAQALPALLQGHDVAGQAQTGTGKTACFLLATLDTLLEVDRIPGLGRVPRALCVAPTRELAIQIAKDCESLSTYTDLRHTIVCGGLPWGTQAKALEDGTDIVMGTPGRLLDFLRNGKLKLNKLEVIVIDEADRMFDMGFIEDLTALLRAAPPPGKRQAMLFSATLSHEVMRLASRWLNEPKRFSVTPEKLTADLIEQSLYHVSSREKLPLLLGLLQKEQPVRTMIFVNRKVDGEELAWRLNHNGYESVYLSGELPQKKRLRIVEAMKAGQIEVLVATDVASRGIHVDDVSHVFNFDLPQDAEDYVHRIGRTARAGASGKAITLACEDSVLNLPAIEKLLGKTIPVAHAEDEDFMPDRSGRFVRPRQTYTGWPPPSLASKDAMAERAEAAAEAPPPSEPDKQRRRRRRGGGGGARGAEGAAPSAPAAASGSGEGGESAG
ncbi:MAG: DEAD/DEAH box helicase [Deltaproteobacteria bacterium]|nr:DEAD/DEAH box helicase [Deltaproteobacteria bacterium]